MDWMHELKWISAVGGDCLDLGFSSTSVVLKCRKTEEKGNWMKGE